MFAETTLLDAHRHAAANRGELGRSGACGCFFCLATFAPASVERWLADGAAVCPECQIDSVLGDASGLPVTDAAFLRAMHARWFEQTTPVTAPTGGTCGEQI